MDRIPPKVMADQLVKLLRKQHPDPSYVKKVFQVCPGVPRTEGRICSIKEIAGTHD